jgi:hypothetical protein
MRRSSFIVRVERGPTGDFTGVIERVATGAKEPFRGFEAIGALIARMVEAENPPPPTPEDRDHGKAST